MKLKTMIPVEQIEAQLERLNVSTDSDSYSGVSAEESEQGIKLFDDYASGIYEPEKLLKILEAAESASLDSDDCDNIWDLISSAEI